MLEGAPGESGDDGACSRRLGSTGIEHAGETAEIRVRRTSGQNGFRVYAWSDLRRVDRVPDEGWLTIDWEKKK